MLTLSKTQFTFVALNQCGVILPDTSTLILLLFKDIRLIRHLRTIGKSIIGLGIRQRHSLNCSKDDGFSLFNPTIACTLISSVLWASPLKIVYKANSRKVDVVLGASKTGGVTSYRNRPTDTNDRRQIKQDFSYFLYSFFFGKGTIGDRKPLLLSLPQLHFPPAVVDFHFKKNLKPLKTSQHEKRNNNKLYFC